MRLPKVLLVHNSYQQRGGEDVVVEAERDLLRARGHDVLEYRISNHDTGQISSAALAGRTFWAPDSQRFLSEALRHGRPDIVHVHNTFPLISPSILWASSQARIPTVQTLHNFRLLCPQAMFLRDGRICEDCLGRLPLPAAIHGCYRGSRAQSLVTAAMLGAHRFLGTYQSKVTRFIALNQFCREKFVQGGLPEDRIDVKPNFADVQAPIETERKGILYVGRLSSEKGLDTLSAALEQLPDVVVDVVGAGPDGAKLASHPRVRMHGWQEPGEVRRRMAAAEVLVMPSLCYETFAIVAVEAFASGLPVLASRLGSLAELIKDGETGLLFDAGSPIALANAMRWAHSHPEDMRKIGRNARTEYEKKYTPERNYALLMEIYERALSQDARS